MKTWGLTGPAIHSSWGAPSATAPLSPPTGNAYSLGRAEYGRLGLGEGAEEKSIPTLISRLPCVSSVACGASVGYAVTKDGKWGCLYLFHGPGNRDFLADSQQVLTSTVSQS